MADETQADKAINTISDEEWRNLKARAAARNPHVSPRRPIGGGRLGAQGYKGRHRN